VHAVYATKVKQHFEIFTKQKSFLEVRTKIFQFIIVTYFHIILVMPRGIPICKELKQMVINAHLERKKQSAISKQFLLPKYSVSKIISTYNRRGHLDKIPKSGRPRKTTTYFNG
jgi:hypothetical protein